MMLSARRWTVGSKRDFDTALSAIEKIAVRDRWHGRYRMALGLIRLLLGDVSAYQANCKEEPSVTGKMHKLCRKENTQRNCAGSP